MIDTLNKSLNYIVEYYQERCERYGHASYKLGRTSYDKYI